MQRCRIVAAIMCIFLRPCNSDLHWNRKHDGPDKDAYRRRTRRQPFLQRAHATRQQQQQQQQQKQQMSTTTAFNGSALITTKSVATIKRKSNCSRSDNNSNTVTALDVTFAILIALMMRQGDEASVAAIAVNSEMNAVVVAGAPSSVRQQHITITSSATKELTPVSEEEWKNRNGEDAASHRNHPRFNNDRRNGATNEKFSHGENSIVGSNRSPRPPPPFQTFQHSRFDNSFNDARLPLIRLRRSSSGRHRKRRRRRLRKSISNAVIETANCEHVELIDCDEYEPNDQMRCMITATGMPCCVCSGKLKRRARHWTTIF